MINYLIRFFTYNKLYLFTGVAILLLIFIPTKEKISEGTRKALYIVAVLWIICFAYKINTGRDIIYLFKKSSSSDFNYTSSQPAKIKGPFNKYYSNEAGRKSK